MAVVATATIPPFFFFAGAGGAPPERQASGRYLGDYSQKTRTSTQLKKRLLISKHPNVYHTTPQCHRTNSQFSPNQSFRRRPSERYGVDMLGKTPPDIKTPQCYHTTPQCCHTTPQCHRINSQYSPNQSFRRHPSERYGVDMLGKTPPDVEMPQCYHTTP